MAAFFKTRVSHGAVLRAEHLFAPRKASPKSRLSCAWRRDGEGRLAGAWSADACGATEDRAKPLQTAAAA